MLHGDVCLRSVVSFAFTQVINIFVYNRDFQIFIWPSISFIIKNFLIDLPFQVLTDCFLLHLLLKIILILSNSAFERQFLISHKCKWGDSVS